MYCVLLSTSYSKYILVDALSYYWCGGDGFGISRTQFQVKLSCVPNQWPTAVVIELWPDYDQTLISSSLEDCQLEVFKPDVTSAPVYQLEIDWANNCQLETFNCMQPEKFGAAFVTVSSRQKQGVCQLEAHPLHQQLAHPGTQVPGGDHDERQWRLGQYSF